MNMLSVIIPAYNEEQALGNVLDELKTVLDSLGTAYEIIVVDDGSTDNTVKIIEQKGIARLVRHQQNQGYGAALKSGIKKASGDFILTFDADETYHASDILKLLDQSAEYDMVVGSRTGKIIQAPFYRKPAKWFLTGLANYLSRTKIPDLNSGMRIFKKEDVEQFLNILPSGFSFTTTITLAYLCHDYSINYVPVNCYRGSGNSKIKPIRDGLNFVLLIFRTITYFNPLRVFLPLALVLMIAALIFLIYSLLFLNAILDATVVALFVASIQIAVLGLLADAIAKKR